VVLCPVRVGILAEFLSRRMDEGDDRVRKDRCLHLE
jgi:hypothetical protein